MKKIGLIGGLSPESTVHYYQAITREANRQLGELNFPELTLESLNLQTLVALFGNDDWEGVAEILLRALDRLRGAGAEFAAILANTPHNALDLIRDRAPLEILSIMDATCAALTRDQRKRVALLGTRPTMEYGFFQRHFAARGVETLVPEAPQRRELDRVVWEELSHGIVRPASRTAALGMVADLEKRGVEAVVLGCTELGFLLQPADTWLPLYDTTEIHAAAIVEFALGREAGVNGSGDGETAGEPSSPVCYLPEFQDR
jgi:aspartate racemase